MHEGAIADQGDRLVGNDAGRAIDRRRTQSMSRPGTLPSRHGFAVDYMTPRRHVWTN
jgi:hypothetical protein